MGCFRPFGLISSNTHWKNFWYGSEGACAQLLAHFAPYVGDRITRQLCRDL